MDVSYFRSWKNENKTGQFDELGQILVSRALDDTKTIGKVGADIFANFGAEKPWTKPEQIKRFSGMFPIYYGLARNSANSRTNG